MAIDFTKFLTDAENAPKPKRLSRFQQLNNAITDSELSEKHKEELREYVPVLLETTRLSYKGFTTMIEEFIRVIPDNMKTQRILLSTTNKYRNLVFSGDYNNIDTTSLNTQPTKTKERELDLSEEVF